MTSEELKALPQSAFHSNCPEGDPGNRQPCEECSQKRGHPHYHIKGSGHSGIGICESCFSQHPQAEPAPVIPGWWRHKHGETSYWSSCASCNAELCEETIHYHNAPAIDGERCHGEASGILCQCCFAKEHPPEPQDTEEYPQWFIGQWSSDNPQVSRVSGPKTRYLWTTRRVGVSEGGPGANRDFLIAEGRHERCTKDEAQQYAKRHEIDWPPEWETEDKPEIPPPQVKPEPSTEPQTSKETVMEQTVIPYSLKIVCPKCGYKHRDGWHTKMAQTATIGNGAFVDDHLAKTCHRCGYQIQMQTRDAPQQPVPPNPNFVPPRWRMISWRLRRSLLGRMVNWAVVTSMKLTALVIAGKCVWRNRDQFGWLTDKGADGVEALVRFVGMMIGRFT